MRYNKLVRDRIPEIIASEGGKPVTHIAGSDEIRMLLVTKLHEEIGEFLESWNLEELADFEEVIRGLANVAGFSPDEVESKRVSEFKERGGFSKGIVLEEA